MRDKLVETHSKSSLMIQSLFLAKDFLIIIRNDEGSTIPRIDLNVLTVSSLVIRWTNVLRNMVFHLVLNPKEELELSIS